MPDAGRLPDLATLTRGELQRTRRDLAAALALARPGSTARLPIGTHLAAIDAELATRVSQHSQLPAAAPGTGPGPDIEEVRGPLEHAMHLRMALDLLQERLTTAYTCDGLESELWALREKIDAAELTQRQGHRRDDHRLVISGIFVRPGPGARGGAEGTERTVAAGAAVVRAHQHAAGARRTPARSAWIRPGWRRRC